MYLAGLEVGQMLPDFRQRNNVIRKTSQMLNLNVKLLEHFIVALKKFREKCGRLQRKTSIASVLNSALTLNVTHFALVCAQLLSDRLEDPHFMLGMII